MNIPFELVELLGLITVIAVLTIRIKGRLALEISTESVLKATAT
jgi:hypothetical protein